MADIDFSVLFWFGIAVAFVPAFALGLLVGWWLL